MEVHQHSHTHGKKTWKNYFWEFLMLFLAVFCGFMAEYQLEHKIESDREKVYIKSMIEDLQTDTASLNKSIFLFAQQDICFDTVFNLFPALAKGYNHTLRTNLDRIIGYRDFFPTDKTMQQLKNSGNLRLIRNKKAVDGIVSYDALLKVYDKSLTTLDIMFTKMFDISGEIIDQQFLELHRQSMTAEAMEKTKNTYLLKSDNASLGKYYNSIKAYRLLRQIVVRRMNTLHENATALVVLLKKEYDLE
jgi:hypothetical protein